MNNALVSVVTPVYGCSGCLEDLVDRVEAALEGTGTKFEMLLVDDGSPDGAWARITELARSRPWLTGVRLSRNFGQHPAIAAGLQHARGDVVVVMDCDLQDPPESIPALLAALEGPFDVAFAQRTGRRDPIAKRLASRAFSALLSWLTGAPHDHSTANFGAFSRRVVDTVNAMPEGERCFPLMVKWTGFATAFVPVRHAPRTTGASGYDLMKLVRLALNIVLSYSDKPLRLVVKLGIVLSGMAMLIVLVAIYRYGIGDVEVAGYTSIVASIWLLGGATIFCIGITGLYVGRLFNDAKGRPHYIVSERTPAGERA